MTAPVELADFLLARFAEEEATARETAEKWGRDWRYREDWSTGVIAGTGEETRSMTRANAIGRNGLAVAHSSQAWDACMARHVATFDPARVLADIAAKRAIVNAWAGAAEAVALTGGEEPDPDDAQAVYLNGLADGLRTACLRLALPYAGHEDYREEWRP